MYANKKLTVQKCIKINLISQVLLISLTFKSIKYQYKTNLK